MTSLYNNNCGSLNFGKEGKKVEVPAVCRRIVALDNKKKRRSTQRGKGSEIKAIPTSDAHGRP
jgi:hypothetical protein